MEALQSRGHVVAQEGDPRSTLSMYREALRLRRLLQGAEELTWVGDGTTEGQVVHFARPGNWESVTNFGDAPEPLPSGEVLLASRTLRVRGELPGETTVWLRTAG